MECKSTTKGDLVFVVDASSSIGKKNWKRQLNFLGKVTDGLPVEQDHIRVALVTFNSEPCVEFDLEKFEEKEDIERAISKAKFLKGYTATGDALDVTRESVLRQARPDVNKVVVLITDGKANRGVDPIEAATRLKDSGARLVTVGIGKNVD